ncbi:rCG64283, partial [Rattus norvegicus]
MSSPDEAAVPAASEDKDSPPTGGMNFWDQVFVPEADLGQDSRKRLGNPVTSRRVPEGPSLFRGPLEIGEGEGSLPGPESSELESGAKLEATEERGGVLRDPECQTTSPIDQEEVDLDFLPQLSNEAMTIMRELTNLQTRKVCRYPSPQTYAAELAALWENIDEGSNRRALSLSSVKGKQAFEGAPYPRGLGRGRAWVTPRRGTISRMVSSEVVQYPSSNTVSSDELSDTQVRKVTTCLKEGDQARSSGLTELDNIGKHTTVHSRGNFVHVPPSVLSSATWGLSSGMERQASAELESSLFKKKPNMGRGKEGSSPKKKQVQEKNSSLDVSRGPQGRNLSPWGQRLKSAPVGLATLPPISGVALLGKASKCSLPSGPKECKPFCTGKKFMVKKSRETQAGPKEDNNSPRDPGLQAQVPPHRAEQPSVCMYRGEMSSGDCNTRASQVPGNLQFLSLSQRCPRPRAPAPAGEEDAIVGAVLPGEERQQELQGTPGCAQCLMFQKEIDELKEQLGMA